MRWIAILLATTACNQVFGLHETQQVPPKDAEYFDAPIDAPPACPPAGTTPKFSTLLHQDFVQNCTGYTISASSDRATAICTADDGTYFYLGTGTVDMSLVPATGIHTASGADLFLGSWLTPEGDTVIVAESFGGIPRWRRYQRQSDGTWAAISDLGISPNFGFTLSGVTRSPNPHLIRYDSNADFQEVIDDGTNTWATIVTPSFTASELGVGVKTYPHLSADGLRLTFVGSAPGGGPQHVYFTDRATIGDRFRHAEPLPGVPLDANAFMTDACARVYVSGLGSIFHVQEL